MQFKKPISKAFILWLVVTLFVIASSIWLSIRGAFYLLFRDGPHSILGQNLLASLFVWLLLGLTLLLLHLEKLNAKNALSYAGFLLISLLYINLLRERIQYGDLEYYLDAATQLFKNRPLPKGYLYPPFWAAVLEPWVWYGKDGVTLFSWVLNVISIMAFYYLLIAALERYGFSNRTAVLVVVLFLLINVPTLRTLYYGQVNLHVVNLILLTLLLYPRQRFLSALALAVAVHFKISPIIIAFVFLLERDWRWMLYFGINLALVGVFPILTDGLTPYLDFLRNTQEVVGIREINFREGSIDAMFLTLYNFRFVSLEVVRIMIYTVKALVMIFAFMVMFRNVRNKTFYSGPGEIALNAMPVVLLMLNLASPLVWEHHGVFLTLPFLLLLKKINTSTDWLLFALAYTSQFLMPTFDYYPWSTALRLSAPLIALWLTYRIASDPQPAPAFEKAEAWLTNLH